MNEDDAEIGARDQLFGEEAYKNAGSPMFTKRFTYQELQTIERPSKKRKNEHEDFKRPDNWPRDTQPEPGSWVYWLPEGWAQGIRTQEMSGMKLSCYMNPDGKRFWHRKDIEKFLGRQLPKQEPPSKKDSEHAVVRVRYVTDPDAIPNWPDDEEEWLPKDWTIGFRQLPSGLHRIYIPPGLEDEGFLYHRSTVMEWLAGMEVKVSPWGTSKSMAAISEAAVEKRQQENVEAATGKKGKRRRQEQAPSYKLEDFKDQVEMRVVVLEGPADGYAGALREVLNSARGAPNVDSLASDAGKIGGILVERGFQSVNLVYVFIEQDKEQEPQPLAMLLSGFFYQQPGSTWNKQPFYRGIRLTSQGWYCVDCNGIFFSWSTTCGKTGRWKLGHLEDGLAGTLALSAEASMTGKWLLLSAKA